MNTRQLYIQEKKKKHMKTSVEPLGWDELYRGKTS